MAYQSIESNDSKRRRHGGERAKQPVFQALEDQYISDNLPHCQRLAKRQGGIKLMKHAPQAGHDRFGFDSRPHQERRLRDHLPLVLGRNLINGEIHFGHGRLVDVLPDGAHDADYPELAYPALNVLSDRVFALRKELLYEGFIDHDYGLRGTSIQLFIQPPSPNQRDSERVEIAGTDKAAFSQAFLIGRIGRVSDYVHVAVPAPVVDGQNRDQAGGLDARHAVYLSQWRRIKTGDD